MSYRTRDQRIADEVSESYLACAWCKKLTLVETLGQYGSRCWPCFEAYCLEIPSKTEFTLDEKMALLRKMRTAFAAPAASGKAWAYALRARAQSGERLSVTQQTMLRAAIGHE